MRSHLIIILIIVFGACSSTDEHLEQTQNPSSWDFEKMRIADPLTGEIPSHLTIELMLKLNQRIANKFQKIFPNTWSAVDDQFASLAISKLAFDPNNTSTYYFSTGEGWGNGGAQRGAGIWKSTDAGLSWFQLPSTDTSIFNYCQDLVVHPDNSYIYVSTAENGVMRSVDGGASWDQVLGKDNGSLTNNGADLEIGTDGTLYACLGLGYVGGGTGSNDGIYRSATGNSGEWDSIQNGMSGKNFHRIEIATAASDPNRLYAVRVRKSDDKIDSIYRSDNKGDFWYSVALPGGDREFARVQGWYDLIIAVDPNDEDVVVVGGLDIWRSRDGGDSWQRLTEGSAHEDSDLAVMHVDQHEIYFLNSDTVFFGNDGGIYMSDNFRAEHPRIIDLNANYNVTQFYAVDIGPNAVLGLVLGGTQDNGSHMSADDLNRDFENVSGADGSFCAIDYSDPSFVYTTTQYRRMYRSKDGERVNITNRELEDNNTLFINQMCMDPNDPQMIYQASNKGVWRLENARTSGRDDWKQACRPLGSITALASSKSKPDFLMFGRYPVGTPYKIENARTSDGNYIPQLMDKNFELPVTAFLNCIVIDPEDENHVLLIYSNYNINSVYETFNAQANDPDWHSCEGNLPNIPIRWAVLKKGSSNVCMLATELGIWYTTNLNGDSTVWKKYNGTIPNIRVDMIRYQQKGERLVVGTHGRGIFEGEVKEVEADLQFTFVERGPSNIGGRTRTIMLDPNDPSGKKLWAGSIGGGLWVIGNMDSVERFWHKSDGYLLFPNPVQHELTVVFPSGNESDRTLNIYSMNGELVYERRDIVFHSEKISLLGLSPGIYIVELFQGDQRTTRKILIH